jgi:ADP-heptose:LPS heptosyltransferase
MRRGSIRNRVLDRYIGIPVLFVISLFKRKRQYNGGLKRIGLLASPGLGDVLLGSGVVADLRKYFPSARLICIAPSTSQAAARLLPYIDEVVPVNVAKPFRTVRCIRRCKLDALVDFTPWPRLTAFYAAVSGARLKVGFRSPGQYRHWNYDLVADHSSQSHEVENFRNLVRSFGLESTAAPEVRLPLPAARSSEGARVVFHPWASGDLASQREWPEERWVELGRRLNSSELTVIITGGPGDVDRCMALQTRLFASGIHAEAFCGASDLRPVAAMFQVVDLVVSVNTGIMHLAAIAGAPTISLNGPTATHRYGPVGLRTASVEPASRAGGFLHFGYEFKGNPPDTMLGISVDDVMEAVHRIAPAIARQAFADDGAVERVAGDAKWQHSHAVAGGSPRGQD